MSHPAAEDPPRRPCDGAAGCAHRFGLARLTRWIGRYPSVPAVLLVVLVAGLALGLVQMAARGQDKVAIAQSETLIEAILAAQVREVGKEALNQAYSGDAVAHLSRRPDAAWADRHIGSRAYRYLDICASLVLPPTGVPSFAFVAGEEVSPHDLLGRFGPGLALLVRAARAADPTLPGFEAGLVAFDNQPYIAGVSAVTPEIGRLGGAAAERAVLVFLRALDEKFLTALGAEYSIVDLHRVRTGVSSAGPSLALTNPKGRRLGRLQWHIDLPSPDLVRQAAWPLAAAFLLLAALAVAVMATIKEAGRNLEVSLAMLAERNRDLTASEAAGARLQARLQSALEYSPEAIAFFDSNDRLIVCNAHLAEVLALPGGALAPGASFERVRAWLADCRLVARDEEADGDAETDGRPSAGEYEVPDGRIVEVRRASTSDGGLVITLRDISEQRRGEAELRAALREAELADRAKAEFLANVSHELRTPLNAIIGFSEVMKTEMFGPLGNENYGGYVRDIHDSGRHLLAVINDILDLSKIEAGRWKLEEELVDLAEVSAAALRIVRERAQAAGLTVGLQLPHGLPTLLADSRGDQADPDQPPVQRHQVHARGRAGGAAGAIGRERRRQAVGDRQRYRDRR